MYRPRETTKRFFNDGSKADILTPKESETQTYDLLDRALLKSFNVTRVMQQGTL